MKSLNASAMVFGLAGAGLVLSSLAGVTAVEGLSIVPGGAGASASAAGGIVGGSCGAGASVSAAGGSSNWAATLLSSSSGISLWSCGGGSPVGLSELVGRGGSGAAVAAASVSWFRLFLWVLVLLVWQCHP